MSEVVIALIALSAMAWVIVVERGESSNDLNVEVQNESVDNNLSKYGPKILGATFHRGEFTGYWYEDGRLEVMHKGKLIQILYLVEEDRAEFEFLYQIRNRN